MGLLALQIYFASFFFQSWVAATPQIQATLFDGCTCSVDQETESILSIAECDSDRNSLSLSKDSMGYVMVDQIFVNEKDGMIKQRTIRFEGNPGLFYVNWDVFTLYNPNATQLKLDEVIFVDYNPMLKVEMRPVDEKLVIDKLTIQGPTAVRSVNVYRGHGINWLQIYADFINDTLYIGKFVYGNTPSYAVNKFALIGETGKTYRIHDFLNQFLSSMVSRRSLIGFKLQNLQLKGADLDLSVMLKGAVMLKQLIIANCYYDQHLKQDFMQRILGNSYQSNCSVLGDIPMDLMDLQFSNAQQVIVEKGALGDKCPQSKNYGGAQTSPDMVAAWGRRGSRQCRVLPPRNGSEGFPPNIDDDVCVMCMINSRTGPAYIEKPDCRDYSNEGRMGDTGLRTSTTNAIVGLIALFIYKFF
ncbi:uncharacterized protein LOC142338592 [Convolutriloba macropyga]|uniref:uncharacterized protein LOC142338592 n=1 Tax=Convolutriloba macropyga TaxID=536237 RepID=UPI003F52749B